MKKVRRDARRGYSVTVMREISLLLRLKHENIVELFEVCTYAHDGLFLVMTCMEIDLLSLYYSKVNGRRCVAEPWAKWFMKQLLEALAFCHRHAVVHRDVKVTVRTQYGSPYLLLLLFNNDGSRRFAKLCKTKEKERRRKTKNRNKKRKQNNIKQKRKQNNTKQKQKQNKNKKHQTKTNF